MSTIVTRSGKGSPLTHTEVDDNFTNLNTDKYQSGDAVSFTTLTATGQTSLGGAVGSESVFVAQDATSGQNSLHLFGGAASGASGARVAAAGSATNVNLNLGSKGTSGVIRMFTNVPSVTGTWSTYQMAVAHTASAVNYVQVTGAATGGSVQITTQGSDNNVGTIYGNKGVGSHSFRTAGTTSIQFQITNTTNAVNRLEVTGGIAGAAPVLSAQGSDTNIDLALTPKGTGLVKFGTYTAGAVIQTGYINIKAADGTTYKVLVGT